MRHSRRSFLKTLGLAAAASSATGSLFAARSAKKKPNIILCMTDDQGWGDTGYNGHPDLKTPTLDAMAREALRFDRFYAAAPVCSPTRGSAITGRHPYRYGIFFANTGHIRKPEFTLAEALKTQGYATGHFGKWHLGTLTKTVTEANRGGPRGVAHYAPPTEHGFDEYFATESKVPTYDPMKSPDSDKPYGTHYWASPDHRMVTENLEGDDSRIIMDRAVPFIQKATQTDTPFFTVIWFHAPHLPVVAGPKHLAMYKDHPGKHYLGCITAMDEQVGRLRKELRGLGVADDTMLWFCSDNGPEAPKKKPSNGSAGPFRGRKRSLFEGGIRVPGLLEWPAKIKTPRRVSMPCGTLDYFPTVLDVLGFKLQGKPEPRDGVSLLPLIEGKMKKRPVPIAFESSKMLALSDNRYKLYSGNSGKTYMLFDLIEDPSEKRDLAKEKPQIVASMRKTLEAWRTSCKKSLAGDDYADPFTPGPDDVHPMDKTKAKKRSS